MSFRINTCGLWRTLVFLGSAASLLIVAVLLFSGGAFTRGSGPHIPEHAASLAISSPLSSPGGITVASDSHIMVADAGLGAIVRVDPVNGDRSIVSDDARGTGPGLLSPSGIVELNGKLVVTDTGLGAIVEVDPDTGNRSIVSDASTGAGPRLVNPIGIAISADDSLLVTDAGLGAVVKVDPNSGDRTIVASRRL